MKEEPEWMRKFRLKSLDHFERRQMPKWGGRRGSGHHRLPEHLLLHQAVRGIEQVVGRRTRVHKEHFRPAGDSEAERKFLAGVGAQYESEVVYHSIREDLEKLGVLFLSMDQALREHPELVKEYFGRIIPPNDNKFSALNSSVWSGGSFVWVPPGVKVDVPLQAYFRINSENMGQFERTLIIAEPGSEVHYVEGCTAPTYTTDSLHSAVVEIIAKEGSRVRYTTIQNWSSNVYNLVTKRATAHRDATVEWIDCNLGSRLTMKYPSVYMLEPGAHGEVLSIAYAGKGQHQDAGAKMVHAAPDTSSVITSKSISKNGGRATYRGLLKAYRDRRTSRRTFAATRCFSTRSPGPIRIPTLRLKRTKRA